MEFDCIVYLMDDKSEEELEKYENLGIELPEEEEYEDQKIVKYSFDASNIVEIRQTFIKYKDNFMDAVCVTFLMDRVPSTTPPLLISYNNFKEKLNEYNKKGS